MAGLGDYELQSQIGAGTSGTVWRAIRSGPVAQPVAVKRLRSTGASPDGVARLRAEAAVLAELDHPHIVRVLEIVPDGDSDGEGEGVAIVMSYAAGGSLDTLLAQRGPLTAGETVAVAVPVAEALASAHRRGIVHGDVKPANVLFTSDGEPLLGDFGIARTVGHPPVDPDPSVVVGTAPYLAPELFDGAAPDARSDVYSLGVVCYEALTGRLPNDGATPEAVVDAARAGGCPPLAALRSDVPEPLAAVIEHAMTPAPEDRLATAELMARALRAALPTDEVWLPGTVTADTTGHHAAGRTADDENAIAKRTDAGAGPASGSASDLVAGSLSSSASGGLSSSSPSSTPATSATSGPGSLRPGERRDHPQPEPNWGSEPDGGDPIRSTRTFGPRPPQPEPPAPRRPLRVPIGAVVVLATAGVVYLVRGPLRDGGDCPAVQEPVVDAMSQVVAGDPEGDGCDTYGVYQLRTLGSGEQAMVLTIPVDGERQSIRLGEPGDQVFLGDWDCDGTDTPGVYRRARGEVQRFGAWPEVEGREQPPQSTEPAPPNGRATLQPAGEGGDDQDRAGGGDGDGDGRDSGSGDNAGSGGNQDDDRGAAGTPDAERCDRITVTAGTPT